MNISSEKNRTLKKNSSNSIKQKKRPPMKLRESLHFKFSWIQIALFIFVIGGTIIVLLTVQRSLMLEKGYKIAEEIGARMVVKLKERIQLAEALSSTMATISVSLKKDARLFKRIIPRILDYKGEEKFIAGGGIWPEPYLFTPGIKRRSFFWGRNKKGKLIYYNDYNEQSGPGYHNEEWYLPLILSPSRSHYWSRSYMDPYSYQPMVTCTAPMTVNGKTIGVATVDLKLEGLDELFKKSAKTLGGYIFATDRNNKLLSFPNHKMAKKYTTDKKRKRTEEFLYIEDLAKSIKSYSSIAKHLKKINERLIAKAQLNPNFTSTLIDNLHKKSHQITSKQAKLIAALLIMSNKKNKDRTINRKRLFTDNDPILKESSIISIFVIPETYWKIIVVTPKAVFYATAETATIKIALYVVLFELIALFAMFFLLNRLLIKPIRKMAEKIREAKTNNTLSNKKLPDKYRDELGALAYEFNRRTEQLIEAIEQTDLANDELYRLRNYLSNIIDSMPSVIIGVDKNCIITQWNKKAEQITKVNAKNAHGKPLTEVFPQLSPEIEKIKKSIRNRKIKQDQKKSWLIENSIHFIDITIYPLIANDVEGAVIRIDDVTEKVRIEEMMIQNEKMLSVGSLAAGMAHEINNPLAGIIQSAEVIESRLGEKGNLQANQRAAEDAGTTMEAIHNFIKARGILEMIAIISSSSLRVSEIVKNMLSFARKSDSQFSLHKITLLIDKSLQLAATDYNLKKQQDFKSIKIEKKYEANLPPVPCDSGKIQQVLLNIFQNGAQAMQEFRVKEPLFSIKVDLDRMKEMICIEIKDNGPGMDNATSKRVFEPFFTTKEVGIGTGLGLSISYFIITENHNGEMSVESHPGAGAKFIIRLPLKQNNFANE